MRPDLPRGAGAVLRFPVERRARPSLDLLRALAPDLREVLPLVDEFDSAALPHELRHEAERAMADRIRHQVPSEPGAARAAALDTLLHPFLVNAIEASGRAQDAAAAARAARQRADAARTAGGFWMAPIEARAASLGDAAARSLVEAYVESERAEGAARAVRFARAGEAWQPFELRAEAAALFFGAARRDARR